MRKHIYIVVLFFLSLHNTAAWSTETMAHIWQPHYRIGVVALIYLLLQQVVWFLWFLRLNRLVLRRYDRYDMPNFPDSKKQKPSGVSNDQ